MLKHQWMQRLTSSLFVCGSLSSSCSRLELLPSPIRERSAGSSKTHREL